MKIEIIAEAKDYLVVNKPAGLVVHGAPHIQEETMADLLVAQYPEIKTVGEDPTRPGIIHRLDKHVSGLLVVCRNNEFFKIMKKEFQQRQIKKEYTALVYGKIIAEEGEINFPIKRSSDGYKMAAMPLDWEKSMRYTDRIDKLKVRSAVTKFQIIKRLINYTLLNIEIATGRTHQIRVHCFSYGHPIVGDDMYATRKTKEKNKKLSLNRIFLVATKLSFLDTDRKRQEFSIDLPADLQEFLKTKAKKFILN